VVVFYGSSGGLSRARHGAFSQAVVPGDAERDDRFGAALATGDFDRDGRDDLAVGVPGEDIAGRSDAGAVVVLDGSNSGLRSTRSKSFSQAGKVKGTPQAGDTFGQSLAVGDFDGDGRDDLAIGVPGEDVKVGSTPVRSTCSTSTGSASGTGGTRFGPRLAT
jgi:hypothetical protein